MKTTEIKETVDTLLNIGPWTALSIISVCALGAFIFIALRHFFTKKHNSDKISRNEILDRFNKSDKKQEDMYKEIMNIKSSVAYIYGTMNGKPPKVE